MSASYEETMRTKPFLPFRLDHVPEVIMEKARKELNETEETRTSGIAELRKLVQDVKRLKCRTDDKFLLMFLRVRKFDVKSAFKLLHSVYELKKTYSDVFQHCDVENMKSIFRLETSWCLPYRDADGCAVVVLDMHNWNPDEQDFISVIHCITMMFLNALDEAVTQVCGVNIILNARGMNLRHVRCITPRYLRMFASAIGNGLPMRVKSINYCYEPSIFQYVWIVLRVFLSDKLKQRIHFHGDNVKNLHKIIPKEILSKDYGGDNLHFTAREWCETELEAYYEMYSGFIDSGFDD